MVKKFYVYTCIWLDLLDDRKSGFNPLGEVAFQFLKNCSKHNCIVIVSELVKKELESYASNKEIESLFEPFLEQIVFPELSKKVIGEARLLKIKKSNTHLTDILHALVAKEQDCVMITRDKHFDVLSEIVKVQLPEEVSFE